MYNISEDMNYDMRKMFSNIQYEPQLIFKTQ